jgi:hypothetical protein
VLPAVAAVAVLGTAVAAGVAGGFGGGDGSGASPTSGVAVTTTAPPVVETVPTTAPIRKTTLAQTLGDGSYGNDVEMVQNRLKELGFDPGPIDGQFGGLTRAAIWAFEKLVLGTPREQATGKLTNEAWQRMQDPIVVVPRRPDAPTANHTEIYLPEQVVIFFMDDKPALISHMSSGTGEEWCEEVTISPGERGNETGTEPLKKGECGISNTPGGVFEYDRRVEGIRESGLGSMWNPVYFNYGIAIHGAMNVPLHPASHGCIRIPMTLSNYFQTLVTNGDKVYVFDGVKEPELYSEREMLPTFNWADPDYTTTTTTTTAPPTTVPETVPPTEPPTTPAPTPATTSTVPVPVTTTTSLPPAPTP